MSHIFTAQENNYIGLNIYHKSKSQPQPDNLRGWEPETKVPKI